MRFLEVISGWINRYFSHEEAVYLVFFVVVAFLAVFTLGGVLAPVLTGLILAFLLVGFIDRLKALKVPELVAVYLTFFIFLSVMVAIVFIAVPLLVRQTGALVNVLPNLAERLQEAVRNLQQAFPDLLTPEQMSG